jgi:hypothetical protein
MIIKKLTIVSLLVGTILAMWAFWSLDHRAQPTSLVKTSNVAGGRSHPAAPAHAETFPAEAFPAGFTIAQHQANLEEIAAEKDGTKRDHEFKGLVDSIAIDQIPGLLASLSQQEQSDLTHDLWLRLLRRWATADAQAAAAWAGNLSPQDNRSEATRYVAIAWANVDLHAANAWVSSWPDGAEREAGLTSVAYEGARYHPVDALQIAAALPPNQDNENLINYSVSQWATTDPQAAVKWAQGISDPFNRQSIESNIAIAWATKDPVAAAALVSTLPAGRAKDDAIVGVAQRWVQRNQTAATQWVMQFSNDNGIRDTALQAMKSITNYNSGK